MERENIEWNSKKEGVNMERQRKIQILKDIVNIDSTNGHEEQVANYLQKLLAEHGIESEKVKYDVDRASLVSEIGSSDEKFWRFQGIWMSLMRVMSRSGSSHLLKQQSMKGKYTDVARRI